MIELKADRLVKPNKSHSADWNLEHFKQQFKIVMGAMDEDSLEFDLIGIDVSIANALRRIMIAEIPTMAIENVYILNNTSIVQDEVLAHRLGLVPIKVDPTQFDFRTDDEPPTDLNTVVLTLLAQCSKNPNASPDDVDPRQLYISSNGKLI
jgi:DNA-directed RNA polymerase I and III subunit RPAC1